MFVRNAGFVAVALLAVGVTACGPLRSLGPGGDTSCAGTVAESGQTDGIDLPVPDWMPAGFPLPAGLSLRHLDEGGPGDRRIVTGFIAGGEAAPIVADLAAGLRSSGYEILLAAKGFVPAGNVAIVALGIDPGTLVSVDAAGATLPVRTDEDECPWLPGIQMSIHFESAEPDAARALYAGSSITRATARAEIADRGFAGEGECFVHAGTYSYSNVAGDAVGLQFGLTDTGAVGYASVDVTGEAVFSLDIDGVSGVSPSFRVTPTGFAVDGMFIDALGDTGVVAGTVEVTCE